MRQAPIVLPALPILHELPELPDMTPVVTSSPKASKAGTSCSNTAMSVAVEGQGVIAARAAPIEPEVPLEPMASTSRSDVVLLPSAKVGVLPKHDEDHEQHQRLQSEGPLQGKGT